MKKNIFMLISCLFIVSCVSAPIEKKSIFQEKSNEIKFSEVITRPLSKGIVEKLSVDLRKTREQILKENPDAVIIDANTIICGKGGFLGGGQFFGYNWTFKNNNVIKVNYICEYDEAIYIKEQKLAMEKFGPGFDLNGNGTVWNTNQNGGAGLLMATGKPSFIVFIASTDYISVY